MAARAQNEAADSEKSLVPKGWAVCKADDNDSSRKALVVEVNGCRMLIDWETDPERYEGLPGIEIAMLSFDERPVYL